MQPLPVPRSATRPPLTRSSTRSTSPSVSGRGISARRSIRSSSRRKPVRPVTYASGSPSALRPTAVISLAAAAGSTARERSSRARPAAASLRSVHKRSASRAGSGTPAAPSWARASASTSASGRATSGTRLFLAAGQAERVHERLELPTQDVGQIVHREVDPVVGDPALGEIVSADLGGPVAGADHRAALAGPLGLLLGDHPVEQPGAQHLQRLDLVLELRLLVLLLDDQPGGKVGHAHRAVGGIDALATGAARAKHIDLEVLRLHLDVDFLRLG